MGGVIISIDRGGSIGGVGVEGGGIVVGVERGGIVDIRVGSISVERGGYLVGGVSISIEGGGYTFNEGSPLSLFSSLLRILIYLPF